MAGQIDAFDPERNAMTSDPAFGVSYAREMFARYMPELRWTYIAENGDSYGISRVDLREFCHDCDVYFNLSNLNWIPAVITADDACAHLNTDPVFTQLGKQGMGSSFSEYDFLFTYGE